MSITYEIAYSINGKLKVEKAYSINDVKEVIQLIEIWFAAMKLSKPFINILKITQESVTLSGL